MQIIHNRRQFVTGLSAATVGFVGFPKALHAEPPPETSSVRFAKYAGSVCDAPKYVAAELLRAEGFTDIRYVEHPGPGGLDFDTDFAPSWISWIETSDEPWTVLAGVHSGCLQLIAKESIEAVADLKGKRFGVKDKDAGDKLARIVLAYVGLDPNKDVEWIVTDQAALVERLASGQIDAFLGFPPEPQEALARGIGHSILNTNVDHPWSQYYCCMLAASTDFVDKYPIATKRVMRAFLKAVDVCQAQPALGARLVVDQGVTDKYGYALQGLSEARWDRWRDLDPEDTLRFYALRMKDVGLINSTPQQIMAKGADFRFLDEVRRELKM
jgi:NitT/TauT family transport system substrate-binding protein